MTGPGTGVCEFVHNVTPLGALRGDRCGVCGVCALPLAPARLPQKKAWHHVLQWNLSVDERSRTCASRVKFVVRLGLRGAARRGVPGLASHATLYGTRPRTLRSKLRAG